MIISDLVRSLLLKRGVESDMEIAAFLKPDYELHTHSPYLLEGMESAVSRLLHAIEREEHIAIYADFDCDGIPGAALLSDFFRKIDHSKVSVYIPHRDLEGYGFHDEAIRKLAAEGVSLIITVDVGTVAQRGVALANSLGIDTIVTDHHEITIDVGSLPPALAILNPKLGAYPFRELCGAAVAYKLVQATLQEGRKRGLEAFISIPDGWEKWLLDLVGIATVADMVPLVGENRVFAYYGLQVLRKSLRPGIAALCNRLRLRKSELTEEDIGFSIAPRINAASRMDEPMIALRLLTTSDAEEAERIAARLEELNASRKGVVASIVRQARKSVATRFSSEERIVVLGDTAWKPALLGLAANSIMQERGGVVCLWGRDGNGKLKGSCRSDGSISLSDLFLQTEDFFEERGGHEYSGGFTVSHERVHELHATLKAAAEKLEIKKGSDARVHDAMVTLPEVSQRLFIEVTQLAPFGIGNPKPLFLVGNTKVSSVKRFGKEKNHVEVQLQCEMSGTFARAFEFFKSAEDFSLALTPGASARVLASIERDSFRGGLALRIVDILPK